jgi:hypothetical protein
MSGQEADLVIGQVDFAGRNANQGGVAPTGQTLAAPQGLAVTGDGQLLVADSRNHRVLLYPAVLQDTGTPAIRVIGQADMTAQQPATSATRLSSPVGVAWSDQGIAIADQSNSRVLVFNALPSADGAAADLVLGATDFTTVSAGCSATQLAVPSAVSLGTPTKTIVADSKNQRVVMWSAWPGPSTSNGAAADVVFGQTSFTECGIAATATASSLTDPGGVWTDGRRLLVADTRNNRVLVWDDIRNASNGAPASRVLGQSSMNRSVQAGPASQPPSAPDSPPGDMRSVAVVGSPGSAPPPSTPATTSQTLSSPAHVSSDGTRVVVSDTGNHRVLIWNRWPETSGQPADVVIGQPDFASNTAGQGRQGLNRPTGVALQGHRLYVADTNNHRVLVLQAR